MTRVSNLEEGTLCLLGAGGHAQVVADAALEVRYMVPDTLVRRRSLTSGAGRRRDHRLDRVLFRYGERRHMCRPGRRPGRSSQATPTAAGRRGHGATVDRAPESVREPIRGHRGRDRRACRCAVVNAGASECPRESSSTRRRRSIITVNVGQCAHVCPGAHLAGEAFEWASWHGSGSARRCSRESR